MLKKFFALIFIFVCTISVCSLVKATEISNNYFSLILPDDIKDAYIISKENDGISIFEKVSAKSNQGGFAFAIRLYKYPSDYIGFPGVQKLGELTTPKGVIYDVVFMRPSEAFCSDGQEEIFNRIIESGSNAKISGVNGNKYEKGKGMKGEELYGEILKKYVKAFTEKWDDDSKYESEGMGFMYYTMAQKNINLLDKIGYAYYDINSDGIDELFIGEITKGKDKGIVYDIYTIVDRKPIHVLSGGDIDKIFVCNDWFICNESSLTKKDSNLNVYGLNQNSAKIFIHVTFSYNADNKKLCPYALSQRATDKWECLSKKEFKEERNIYGKAYKRFDFIPFRDFK